MRPVTSHRQRRQDDHFRVADDIIKFENTIFNAVGASVGRTEFVRNTTGIAVMATTS